MNQLLWVVVGGVLMSAIALVGSVTLLISATNLRRLLLPLVAMSAGSMLGGALFHMLPSALQVMPTARATAWIAIGFLTFLALEQFLHWHHCHRAFATCKKPLMYLILIGDGLHNFLGGLAVAGVFLLDARAGMAAWLAAAAHEVPQELGDFATLIHGGWAKKSALAFNFLSGLAFLAGALLAYGASLRIDVTWLVPVATGNFIYVAASDLVPEVNKPQTLWSAAVHLLAFTLGLGLVFGLHGH